MGLFENEELSDEVKERIRNYLARSLGVTPEQIDSDSIARLKLDSLDLIELTMAASDDGNWPHDDVSDHFVLP